MLQSAKSIVRGILDKRAARRAPEIWRSGDASLLVLSYHRVLPRDFDELRIVEPGMYVFEDTFDMHLTVLKEYFEIVDLSDWLRRRAAGESLPGLAVALTFDDGWRDNYLHAFPIMQSQNTCATIFVVTEMIGTRRSFWPERLVRLILAAQSSDVRWSDSWLRKIMTVAKVESSKPGPEAISRVVAVAKRYSDKEVNRNIDRIEKEHSLFQALQCADLANWTELGEMAASGLMRVGSHTRCHTRLHDAMSEQELADELVGSRNDIECRLGFTPELFCYPNGDSTQESRRMVAREYLGACTTVPGWNRADSGSHSLRRIMLHQDRTSTRAAFISRLHSGFSQK